MNQATKNTVKMIVNIGTKPTIKTVRGERKMARFSAVTFEANGNGGKKKKWYSVVSWGSVADLVERDIIKGKRVMIIGHLITNAWTDKKGNAHERKEILATNR